MVHVVIDIGILAGVGQVVCVTTRNVQITSHNIQFNDIHGPTGLTARD